MNRVEVNGLLVGLLMAVAKTGWDISHVHVEVEETDGEALRVRVAGNATFLRLPKLLDALDALPRDRAVELELSGLRHTDHACATALEGWAEAHEARQVAKDAGNADPGTGAGAVAGTDADADAGQRIVTLRSTT